MRERNRGRCKVGSDFSSRNWKKSKFPTCICVAQGLDSVKPEFHFKFSFRNGCVLGSEIGILNVLKSILKKLIFFRSWSSSFDLKSCLVKPFKTKSRLSWKSPQFLDSHETQLIEKLQSSLICGFVVAKKLPKSMREVDKNSILFVKNKKNTAF